MEIFVLCILVGLIPASIAHKKGHHFVAWWVFGSLLFIFALPMALLAKPDREALERREMYEKNLRKCPHCAELIPCEATVCRFCATGVEPAPLVAPPPPVRFPNESEDHYAARVARKQGQGARGPTPSTERVMSSDKQGRET